MKDSAFEQLFDEAFDEIYEATHDYDEATCPVEIKGKLTAHLLRHVIGIGKREQRINPEFKHIKRLSRFVASPGRKKEAEPRRGRFIHRRSMCQHLYY